MMQTFRKNMRLILFIALASFALLIFFQWGLDVTGIRTTPETDIAKVNGMPISYIDYRRFIQAKESEKKGITRDEIWAEMLNEIMWNNLIRKERIIITDDEIWAIIRNNPPRQVYESEYMKNEKGEFDFNKYFELLKSPQSREWLLEYENNLRRELPKEKVRSLISTVGWVSPFEDSIMIVKQSVIYDLSFVSLALFRLRNRIEITDEELKEYYNKNQKEFITPESKILKFVFFERKPSSVDTSEAKERIEDFILRIKEGEDFLTIAGEVSDDSIIESSFTKEDELLPYLANVYKNLKDGQISEIIQGPDGFEVIKRARKGLIYLVKANIQVSQSTIDDIHDKIESFKESVKELGFDEAAKEYNIPVRPTYPLNPEKVTFPVRNTEGLGKFLSKKSGKDEIAGPFSSIGGYYLFTLDSVIPEKALEFQENIQMIRAKFERENLKEELATYLNNIYNQLNSGQTMAQIAASDTLIILQDNLKDLSLAQILSSYGLEFAGAVATLAPNQISSPLITDWAGYIIRCDNKKTTPFDSTMTISLQVARQMRLQQISQNIFTPQKIIDNRDKFFE